MIHDGERSILGAWHGTTFTLVFLRISGFVCNEVEQADVEELRKRASHKNKPRILTKP